MLSRSEASHELGNEILRCGSAWQVHALHSIYILVNLSSSPGRICWI